MKFSNLKDFKPTSRWYLLRAGRQKGEKALANLLKLKGKFIEIKDVKLVNNKIFLNVFLTKELYYEIMNLTNIIGFSKKKANAELPFPLSYLEEKKFSKYLVDKTNINKERNKNLLHNKISFEVGNYVKINDGLFENEIGLVTAINYETGFVTIDLDFFSKKVSTGIHFKHCKKV